MRRFRFWLRLVFYPILVAAIIGVLGGCWVVKNLAGVVSWFAARSLPEFSLHLGDADFAGATRIELTNIELRLRHQNKAVLTIGAAAADFSVADLWHRRIPRLEIENPHVVIDDQSLRALSGPQEQPSAAPAPAGKSKPWRVDQFFVRGGQGDVDLRPFPQAHFQFAGEFAGLDLGAGTKFSRKTQKIALQDIRITSREAAPKSLLEIGRATLSFTIDQLVQHRLQEVTISSPSIHLQPALLAAFSPSTPAAGGSSPDAGWQVGRLTIKNGEFFVDGFDDAVPVTSAKFALDATEIGLGGASEKIHLAQLWDVRSAASFDPLHPFLLLDSLTIGFSNAGLSRNELALIETTGLWVDLGRRLRSVSTTSTPGPGAAAARNDDQQRPWIVRNLSMQGGYVAISDIGLGIPDFGFYWRTQLNDVALSGEERFASQKIQTVELSNISIRSPLDPFVPVLNLKTIFLRFSIAQLLRQEIEEVSILNPQLFVGEDLFWYADALKKEEPAAAGETPAATAATPHWIVKNIGVDFGEIVIANGGAKRATLPLTFSWRAQNLDFNRLDDLQLKLKLVVPPGDYGFPSYELELGDLSGKIEFGLPPEGHQDNLVHTLEVKAIRWKQFVARNSFVSVTYDKKGIYGAVGIKAYGGYLNGGFSFFNQPDSPWTGWMSGSDVSLRGVTDVLAPQSIRLSGPADFKLEVNGLNHQIERVTGSYTMRKPGKLKVTKLDDLLAELPPERTVLKTSLTRIGLETLRDFDYDTGHGSFWLANHEGELQLALEGPLGSRKLEAVLHGERDAAQNGPRQ